MQAITRDEQNSENFCSHGKCQPFRGGLHPKSGHFSKTEFWFDSLGAVGFSLVKKSNLEKEGRGEMGEIFFYLQETSLYEKIVFFHLFQSQTAPELMPGIPSSIYNVLLSGSYCTWHLL